MTTEAHSAFIAVDGNKYISVAFSLVNDHQMAIWSLTHAPTTMKSRSRSRSGKRHCKLI
jgi:hypothetical protein